LEDWDLRYTDDGIDGRPLPISLVWRICTAVIFLGIAGYLASWLVCSMSRGGQARHGTSNYYLATASIAFWAGPGGSQIAQSNIPPHQRTPQPGTDDLRRMTEQLKARMSPEERRRFESRQRESTRELEEKRKKSGRLLTILMWIGYPFLILLIVAFGWVGIWYGLLEAIRFPIDRLSIRIRDGQELAISRPRLFSTLVLTRPIEELATITCEVRRVGSAYRHRHSTTYHWVASLHSRRASELPRIEFFIESQTRQPTEGQGLPYRCDKFVRKLQQLTGCSLSRRT
jgi:hypothetical protein